MNIALVANGKRFEFRPLTEEEASSIQDKKRLASLDKNHNLYDDGDKELLATVVFPSKEEAESFLEENGNFFEQVWQKLLKHAGQQDPEELPLPLEVKAKYNFPVILLGWVTQSGDKESVLFRKIARADTKMIKREIAGTNGILLNRMLVERVKLLCLEPDKARKIAETHPFFFVEVGNFLWEKSFSTIESDLKKV